jgi:RNA polymerase sigma-70 factor (ECF subfamily)
MIQEKRLMMRFNELVTLASALLYDKTTAEDAVHDVFAMLIDRQATLKITQNLKQYLMTAVANAARQRYRTQKRASEVSLDSEKTPETETQKPPESAILALLRHFGELRFKKIASMQSVSINTVQGRYRYGLDKLRSLLNGEMI